MKLSPLDEIISGVVLLQLLVLMALLVPGSIPVFTTEELLLLATPAAVKQLLYRLWISKEVARIRRSVHIVSVMLLVTGVVVWMLLVEVMG